MNEREIKSGYDIEKRNAALENLKEAVVFLLIVIMIILIRMYIMTPAVINGDSMEPTLHDGDIVFLYRNVNEINRFDIIVHSYQNDSLVKRVIGLPGEFIEYESNRLYVSQEYIPENFINADMDDFILTELSYNQIPENYYFLLGDNRNFSKDSRSIGLIHIDDIVGRSVFRIYPFAKFGILE